MTLWRNLSLAAMAGMLVATAALVGWVVLGVETEYLPHGHCYLWRPWILWPTVAAHLIIAGAYYAIPAILVHRIGRIPPALGALHWLFASFVYCCGTTHMGAILVIWWPYYGLTLIALSITAAISVASVVGLRHFPPEIYIGEFTPEQLSTLERLRRSEVILNKMAKGMGASGGGR